MLNKIITSGELSLDTFSDAEVEALRIGRRAAREKMAATCRLLWFRRRLMCRSTVAGLVISVVIAFLIPSQFVSTTRLMPPDQADSTLALLAGAGNSKAGASMGALAGDLLGMKSSGALFVGILQTRTVRDDLINAFDLRKAYAARRWEDARTRLGKNTRISEDSKSGIIAIEVTDKNPRRAAGLAGEYVQELNRVITALNTTSAHRERVFLEDRLTQVQQDLESAEKNFGEFASQNSAIDIQAQSKAMIEAGAALEGELVAAQTELEGLRQVYADGNVRVRATRARVQELQRQVDKLGGRSANGAVSGAAAGMAMYPSLRELPLLGVQYADLFRTTKVQETVYETLTQQYELAKVQEAKETPSIKVIDLPDVPENKSSPHRLWIALLGAGLGLAISAGWTVGCERWGRIDSQDPGKILALEVVGSMRSRWPFLGVSANGRQGTERKLDR
jgi:capsule polysaccharide export protein KpsE/RkpR